MLSVRPALRTLKGMYLDLKASFLSRGAAHKNKSDATACAGQQPQCAIDTRANTLVPRCCAFCRGSVLPLLCSWGLGVASAASLASSWFTRWPAATCNLHVREVAQFELRLELCKRVLLASLKRQCCGTKAPCALRTGTCAGMAACCHS